MAPLNELLKGHPRRTDRTVIKWLDELVTNFKKARKAFMHFTLLNFPQPSSKLVLTCDFSGLARGAVPEQIVPVDGRIEHQPLAFYSVKFNPSQLHWSPYDKELFAIYSAVDHFHDLIEARELCIFTDHRLLINMFTTKRRIKLERQSRWIEFISQYSTNIRYISGKDNVIADTLSRPENCCVINADITSTGIASAQQDDEEIAELKKNGYREHVLHNVFFENSGDSLIFCSVFKGINSVAFQIVPTDA